MENLKELAVKNAEKQSHVRKSVENFMSMWQELTENCENIRSNTIAYKSEHNDYYLITGKKEIMFFYEYSAKWDYMSGNYYFWDHISMSTLRSFCRKLPVMIDEIKEKLENVNTENDQIIEQLEKMINSIK